MSIPGIDAERLERVARAAANLRAGKPLAHGEALHRPRPVADGLEPVELRPFAPGDDARRIDWRASARSRHPLVRRYRDERAGEWTLCLDRSASMGAVPGVWTLGQQLSAALAYTILHLGHRVGVALFSDRLDLVLPPLGGPQAFPRLLGPLALARPLERGGDSRPESCLPLADRGRRILLIGDCLRPDATLPALDRLAAAGGGVELLHLAAPPPSVPDGECGIQDAENEEIRTLESGRAARLAAVQRHEELLARVARHCRAHRIPYTRAELRTDGVLPDWERVLIDHLDGPLPQGERHGPPSTPGGPAG